MPFLPFEVTVLSGNLFLEEIRDDRVEVHQQPPGDGRDRDLERLARFALSRSKGPSPAKDAISRRVSVPGLGMKAGSTRLDWWLTPVIPRSRTSAQASKGSAAITAAAAAFDGGDVFLQPGRCGPWPACLQADGHDARRGSSRGRANRAIRRGRA